MGISAQSENASIVSILARRALMQPDQKAFGFYAGDQGEISVTYRELFLRVTKCMEALRSAGARGERAVILCTPGYDFVTALLACMCAGVVAVPAYPPQRHSAFQRLRTIIEDASARFLLIDGKVGRGLEKIVASCRDPLPVVIDVEQLGSAERLAEIPDRLDCYQAALIQYTSGSTGNAKGVVLSHGNIMANSQVIEGKFGHSVRSKGVIWLPPYHDMGLIGGILQPIYTGFPCLLMPPSAFLESPLRWLQTISKERGTVSGGPNFAYERVVQTVTPEMIKNLDLSSWITAFVGAEWINHATLEHFTRLCEPAGFRRAAWLPCYGLAESTLLVTGRSCWNGYTNVAVSRRELGTSTVGQPANARDAQVLIGCGNGDSLDLSVVVDQEKGTACAEGEVGEVWVSGPSVAQGYWNSPALTHDTFFAELREHPGLRFLRTGDLGFVQTGELYITGRCKELLIVRGANYYAAPIESTVRRSHALLAKGSTAAFVTEDSVTPHLVVVQEAPRSSDIDYDVVIGSIRSDVFSDHGLVLDVVVLVRNGSLPRTSSGKIQRFAAKEMYLDGSFPKLASWENIADIPAQGSALSVVADEDGLDCEVIRDKVLATLARIAGMPQDDLLPDRPLHDQGIDSLKAVQFVREMQAWLKIVIPETLLWECSTVDSLASELARMVNETPAVAG